MFRTWWQKFFSFPRSRFARRRGYRPPNQLLFRTTRLSMTALEDRITPATFTDNGTTLNLTLNTANTNAAVISAGTSYSITLTGDTWVGTNDANVTGNGTATLTVTSAGIAAFTNQISLADAAAAGDSVTFNNSGANSYLNNFIINLSNAAGGSISFNGTSSFLGANSLSATTTENIAVNSGAAVSTFNGNLAFTANEQATPTSGNFIGVNINGGTVQATGTGVVNVSGRGGDAGGDFGVEIQNGGAISGGTTGTTVVSGTGGAGTAGANVGVELILNNSKITSAGSAVKITGQGGGGVSSNGSNVGVNVLSGAEITAGGSGTVTVMGTGGANDSGSSDFGVELFAGGTITSGGGNVSVTGQGGGTGGGMSDFGVVVNGVGATVTAGGSGTVTVMGTGGATSGGDDIGVLVASDNSPAAITSSGGNVSVTGQGGGTGASGTNFGVEVVSNTNTAAISAGGTGTVTVDGTAGGGTGNDNAGVLIAQSNAEITSSGGAVSVTGIGGTTATGGSEWGVWVSGGGEITAGGTATVTVKGTGGSGSSGNNFGVYVQDVGSAIKSAGGNVSITGVGGGTGSGGTNYGVEIQTAATITAGGSGTVTIIGTGGANDTGGTDIGVILTGAGATITSSGGAVSVIGIGGGSGASGSNYGLAIGDGTTITAGGSGTVTVMGTGGNTSGGNDAGVVVAGVATAATITSGGGAVSVTGQGGGSGASSQNVGVAIEDLGVISAGGTGTVTVNGTGGAGTGSANHGVWLTVAGAKVTSSGGSVTVTGTAGTGTGAVAVEVDAGTVISSANNAPVTIIGDSMALNSAPSVNAGTGIATLEPKTAGVGIDLGLGTTAGDLGLTTAELATVTAGTLRIGSTSAGNIVITAPVAFVSAPTLSLMSGGSIAEAASADTISVINLAVRAASGVNLNTVVSHLAVRNTTSGNVSVTNTGATLLTAVDGLDGSAGNQQGNFAGGGTTTFSAHSPFTYAVDFTSGGTITTTTADNNGIHVDNITINSGVTVTSTGGDVVFDAGDDVVINGTVQSQARDVDLVAGFGDTDNEGVITINGTVSAVATVALNVNSTNTALPANTPIVTETATSTISAAGLLLLNLPTGAPGPFNLNASTTNAVGTIAASTNAAINFADAGALTIGSVTSTPEGVTSDGILSNNHAVSIQATGTITLAKELTAGTAAATLNSTGGNILQAGTLTTTGVAGGALDLIAAGAGGINLQVVTSTPATAGVTASTTNAPIILTSTQQLQVDNINAGTGDVTLHVTSANTAASSITSLHPNDNVADVTGHTVTLTADGASSGNTGQIGFFTAAAQFFEVAATTLNASTNNSRAWISLIGGAAIGSDNVGTNTAFLRTFNGTLTSTHTGTTPDIIAAAVNLSQAAGSTSGQFGTLANPLLTQTSTLTAVISAGPSSINVTNVAAGGNLAVVSAKTVSGPINLAVNGGNLTTTAAAGSDISAPGSTVTLTVSGAIISGTSAGVTDVAATNLAIIAGAGIGSVANPLKTIVTNLAFSNSGGVVDVANTGALTINAVSGLLTSSNTGATTTLSAASPMTFAVNTTSAGTLTATTADNGGAGVDNITVNSGVTVQSTGGDVIFHSGDDVDVNGTVQSTFRDVDLVAGFGDTDGEGIINITGTVSAVATVTLNVNATNAALPAGTPIANETATSTITAAGLLLLNVPAGAPGEFSLDSSTTNSVGTIAATTNAEIDFQNSGAFTVGSVTSTPEGVTSFGILTNNHDVTLCALTGDISLTQALNAGTGTARLAAGGAVTQTAAGAITAANLGVAAGGNIGLDQAANAIPGIVALNSTGGSVAFMETDGFTVGTITASDCFPGATGITGGADITICSGLGITLTAPIDTTGTVRIQSGGSVSQTAAGTITAANLGVRADGNINLCVSGAANDISGTFAADASGGPAGSSVMFLDSSGYTVGTISASGCFTADAVGVRSNNGAVDLVNTAGSFAFDEPINAGTGTVRINSAGAVTQANNGVATITAANLAVTAGGVINLCVAASPNAVTGNFAASDSAAGAGIMFLDADGYTVGTVAGDACAAGATGAASNNGDIDLVSFGPITLAQAVNAGTGTVRLNAAGALTQTGAGVITAQNLAAVAGGNIDLSQLANAVNGTFAALNETGGNFIRFQDAPGFTVGTVAGDACAPGATGVGTTAADISLVSTTGPITLLQVVSTATPNIGTVRINSGGAVMQAVGGAGAITAQNLAVVANGTVDLAEVPNTLNGTFAAADSANGAAVQFLDTNGFTVGTIAADPAALGATGVVTTNGDIDLVSTAGPITLGQAVNAGTATVRINSGAAVTQSGAAGAITAANLAVVANGPVNLCVTPNTVSGSFAAQDTGAGASVMFNDTVGITVSSVAGDAHAAGATGVVTNNGDIDLVSNGSIAFANNLNAGTGTVRLNAGTTIAQSGGTVTAQNLAVVADGNVDLAGVANSVPGIFAASDTGAGATVRFLDMPGFMIGMVAADTCATGATGVVTTNGDATLVSSTGSIQLQQAIATGAGTTRLQAATGIASIAATGTVTAASLGVRNTTSGDIQLDQANAIGVLAAVNNATGAGINVADTMALTLDAVSADGTLFDALNDVTTTGAGGTVRLQTAGLSQTTNGIVSSDLLGVQNTAGDVILDQLNVVNTFAAANAAAGGRVTLRNENSLVLGTVGSQGTFPTTNGITTNVGTTFLQAAGDVTQTAAGLVNSQALAVNSTVGGTIRLDQGNAVATFAAEEGPTSGLINFRTTVGLTLDTVTSGSALLPPIAGVSTRAGTTLLRGANGITQTATGLIDSATLAVRNDSAGDISLLQTNFITGIGNQVGTFAGINGGAGGRLDFATLGALTLGTVPADGTFAQVRGITTNNGGSNLRSGTDFTAVDTNYASPFITLGSGNFLVNPGQTPVPAAMVNTVVRIVTFNAEAQTTGTFRFGVPKATDAPPPAPPINVPDQSPVPANPTGAATVPPAPDNPFRETFNIRPSANVQILVNGNDPTTAPGDTLNLILTDLASNATIQFTPGGVGSGRFDFPNTRKAVPFTGIETVGGLSVLASSIQTGPHTYTVTATGTLQGRLLFGGISGGQAPANPFIVSPNPVNPVAPFGAARITFGDFNGDGITDLMLANGPANAPLVTVVNGRALFGPQHALGLSDILSQFFAYNPNFQGGMFVAAGDLNGDGRAEIVTGADQGGGPHVRVFSFNPAGTSIYNNAVDYATTFANPANSPFPNGGFYAYNSAFTGGVRVAVGDVNGDGKPDIITGAGPGGGPHVEVFSGATGKIIDSFYAFAPNFAGGVYVAAGDYNKDGKADILTGAGRGGPEVRVFSGADLSVLTQFYAFGPDGPPSLFGADLGDTTGVGSVAFADVNGDGIPDIVVGSNRGPRTRIAAFLGNAVSPPPHFTFTTATNPNPNLFTIDPTTGDLLTLPSFGLRDGSNVAGLFGTA